MSREENTNFVVSDLMIYCLIVDSKNLMCDVRSNLKTLFVRRKCYDP